MSLHPESSSINSKRVYEGWLYHVGVNSLGYQFCRARYLRIKGKYVEMYKRDPNESPRKPIRRGIVGQYFMTEELGRQIFHGRALYAFRIYSRVDCNKQGKLACGCAEEVEKWIAAFKSAKEEAECDMGVGNRQKLINLEQEFDFKGSRNKNRSYRRVSSFGHPITIGKGLRFFEDISETKIEKGAMFMKSVGLVEAAPDIIFDMIMTMDKNQRQQWDSLTGDLELVEDIDGHSDIVHGVYDPKFHKRWCCKKDFLFLRRWRRDQDGSYCLKEYFSIATNDEIGMSEELYTNDLVSKDVGSRLPPTQEEQDESLDTNEQFYDAIMTEDLDEDDGSDEEDRQCKGLLKASSQGKTSWSARLGLPSRRPPNREANSELSLDVAPLQVDSSLLKSSLKKGYSDDDPNSWRELGGDGFMVRGRTYIKDCIKVPAGGDPLLKLLGVDWLKSDKKIDRVAHCPNSLIKSAEAKKLPFILAFNLQLPAKPNYSLVFYFGADRPLRTGSLLHRFVTGDDNFRNARLKLIPRIVEGYWVIKRAVGTKACLLGKALTCKYVREDNFLEIDVDVGSSSVARSVCGLVLGYAASVVIDFAILIEAQEEAELPEYLLGVGRINRINSELAVPFGDN